MFPSIGCKKIIEDTPKSENPVEQGPSTEGGGICDLNTLVCEDCSFQNQIDEEDAEESQTILGGVYNNPYSLSNMTASFNYIYSLNISSVNITHFYVRFKPQSAADLNFLDSLDFELYDYPLNREVIQEGDYWPEAYSGLGEGQYPWLYTVVERSFTPPPGIQTEILESLYIPDNNPVLEDEAYYRTGNYDCDSVYYRDVTRVALRHLYQDEPQEPCAIIDCTGGGGSGGSGGGAGNTNSTRIPAGQINFKTYVTNYTESISASAPLKFVRIVGRRHLKIDKTYTDENGNFRLNKNFPKKVTIIVKFRSSPSHGKHSVRMNHTNVGSWRSMWQMKKNIGTYRANNLQNLNYEFRKGSTSTKRKTRLWIAAVMLNTVEESRLFLMENSMAPLPEDIRFYLNTPGQQIATPQFDFLRRSSAPWLNQDRTTLNDIIQFGGTSLLSLATIGLVFCEPLLAIPLAIAAFSSAPHYPDVYCYYKTNDLNSLSATKVSISTGQQLGIGWLSELTGSNNASGGANRSLYASSRSYGSRNFTYDTYSPWGNNVSNSNYYPQVLAIWESFAQHFGHTIANRIYGNKADPFELQGKTWTSNSSISSNLKYLEEFDPGIGPPSDYFNWIPVGLVNDLLDSTSDPLPVIDNVSGFTYLELQSAYYNKPVTMQDFKNSLKLIKPSQSAQIDALFMSYGY